MAKKKKAPKDSGKETAKDADKPVEKPAAKSVADAALARGNYAAIHHLAEAGDEQAKKLEALTKVDLGQVVVGIVAMAVTLTIMIITLTSQR